MKVLKVLAVLGLLLGTIGAGLAALTIWYFGRDLPDYQQLADYQPPIVTRVHAGDGRLMAEYATEKRIFVPAAAIPPLVSNAFIAAEDHNFYHHIGVDPLAMARALAMDLTRYFTKKRPVGASTITQQVAKNFLVGNEFSYQRKIKEALVAMRIERAMSKEKILELYLNEIYLGGGTYGVAAAALHYFNASLEELTLDQAAFLAALPKSPNNYNPQRYPEAAKARRDWVLDRMVEWGYITPEQAKAAQAKPIVRKRRDETEIAQAPYFTEEVRRQLLARYGDKGLYAGGLSVRTSLDPGLQTAADKALRSALITYDRRHGYRGAITHIDVSGDWRPRFLVVPLPAGASDVGWKTAVVLTTEPQGALVSLVDGSRGRIAFDELKWARRVLDDDKLGPFPRQVSDVLQVGDVVLVEPVAPPAPPKPVAAARGKAAAPPPPSPVTADAEPYYGLRQIPEVSGALVAMDPHTGRVLAVTGGFSFAISQFDRATQAVRQTGSAIKPFVYLAALDHGFTPSTLVLDAPFVVDLGPGQPKWKPNNFEHNFLGPQPLRIGLEESRNLMTARVGAAIGLDVVGSYVERFGIMDKMPLEYSMLLGADETTPLRLTTAFAMLVNGGKRIAPTFIDRVQDRTGRTIYSADVRPCVDCEGAWNGQAPPELPDLREQIADPASVYQVVSLMEGVVQRGTGRTVAAVGKPIAGKTGTTTDAVDTWFVGFTPDLAAGVFVGFDQPRSLGTREQGATVAAPAFRDFMMAALKDKPAVPFRIPPGIRLVRVNAATGQLARPGDKTVIYEAFKPGTEPGGDQVVVTGGDNVIEDGDAAAAVGPAGVRVVPAGGTGGLY